MRFCLALFVICPAFLHAQEEWRPLVREVIYNLVQAGSSTLEPGFQVRRTTSELNPDGKPRTETTILLRRELWDGIMLNRIIARNGVPLTEREMADQRQQLLKTVAAQKAAGKRPPTDLEMWLTEFPDALDYRKIGEEMINGRKALVFECVPHPGYKPARMRARVFEKLKGKVWLDESDKQIVRADAEMFDTVNIGYGILGKVEKGTQFHLERFRLPDGHWAYSYTKARFAARIMLFKTLFTQITNEFSDHVPRGQLENRVLYNANLSTR